MINQASDYIYIAGDLTNVIIDGGIMPLRTGNTGKFDKNGNPIPCSHILRGEDICFLMEAVYALQDSYAYVTIFKNGAEYKTVKNPLHFAGTVDFTKKLSLSQLYGVWTGLLSLFPLSYSSALQNIFALKSAPGSGDVYMARSNQDNEIVATAWSGKTIVQSETASAATAPASAMSFDTVSNMFSDLARITHVCFPFYEFYPAWEQASVVSRGSASPSISADWGYECRRYYDSGETYTYAYSLYSVPKNQICLRMNERWPRHSKSQSAYAAVMVKIDTRLGNGAWSTVEKSALINLTSYCTSNTNLFFIRLPSTTAFVDSVMSRCGVTRQAASLPSSSAEDCIQAVSITLLDIIYVAAKPSAVTW